MSNCDQPTSQLLLAKGSARLVHLNILRFSLRIRLEYTLNISSEIGCIQYHHCLYNTHPAAHLNGGTLKIGKLYYK